ncbi:MAG: hypothetical protein ACI8S6_003346 [Myxococcota bacterium]|jgi:hypothetical protein
MRRTVVLLSLLLACDREITPQVTPPAPEPTPSPVTAATGDKLCEVLKPIYPSHGVHSPCRCPDDGCDAARGPDDPPDPRYPEQWVSGWTMYRVFAPDPASLPPYDSPPADMTEGTDYEASRGTTAYDSRYVPEDGDGTGAMMAHYEDRCLPIFPHDNTYSCTFISLGNKAWLLTGDDRPEDTPPCCMFSPYHHAPKTDFIRNLPYSAEDSSHLSDTLQAYRYVADPQDRAIWFGYSFYRDRWADAEKQHLLPHSSYFTGSKTDPPDAPIVSQNYTDFRILAPDPAETWQRVGRECTADPLPICHPFDTSTEALEATPGGAGGPQGSGWEDITGH